jgi:hypothetical protein
MAIQRPADLEHFIDVGAWIDVAQDVPHDAFLVDHEGGAGQAVPGMAI